MQNIPASFKLIFFKGWSNCTSDFMYFSPRTDSIWQKFLRIIYLKPKKKTRLVLYYPCEPPWRNAALLLSNSCSAQRANARKTAGLLSWSPFSPGSLETNLQNRHGGGRGYLSRSEAENRKNPSGSKKKNSKGLHFLWPAFFYWSDIG